MTTTRLGGQPKPTTTNTTSTTESTTPGRTSPMRTGRGDSFETSSSGSRPRADDPALPSVDDDDVIRVDSDDLGGALAEVTPASLRATKFGTNDKSPLANAYRAFLASRFQGEDEQKQADNPAMKQQFLTFAAAWKRRFPGDSAPQSRAEQMKVESSCAVDVLKSVRTGAKVDPWVGQWAIRVLQDPTAPVSPSDEALMQSIRIGEQSPPPTTTTNAGAKPTGVRRGVRTATSVNVQEDTRPTVNQVVQAGRNALPAVKYTWSEALGMPDAERGPYLFRKAALAAGFDGASVDLAIKHAQDNGVDLFTEAPAFSEHTTTEMLQQRQKAGTQDGAHYVLRPRDVALLTEARLANKTGYQDLSQYEKEKGTTLGSMFAEGSISYLEQQRQLRESLGVDNPVSRALDEYGGELAKVGGNLLNLGQLMFVTKPKSFLQGYDGPLAPEDEAWLDKSMDRVENATNNFVKSIPEETSTLGSVTRAVTGAVVRIPQYAAFAVAPGLATFYEVGKYANAPFDQFGNAVMTDWLMIGTGAAIEGISSSAAKTTIDGVRNMAGPAALENTALKTSLNFLERGTRAAIAGGANTAVMMPLEVQQVMQEKITNPDGSQRSLTNAEAKSRLEARFAKNFSLGVGLAMLGPGHTEQDAKIFESETTKIPENARIFQTMRDGKPEYSTTVVEEGNKTEMVQIDPDSVKGQRLLRERSGSIVEASAADIDNALIASRLKNRVTPENKPALMKEAVRFADNKTQNDAAQTAAKTQTNVATLAKWAGGNGDVPGMTHEQVVNAFGQGPYDAQLGYLLSDKSFADLAKSDPASARALYEGNGVVNVTDTVADMRKNGPTTSAGYQKLADEVRAFTPETRSNGNFQVRVFPKPGPSIPALDLTIDPKFDHNGAMHFAADVDAAGEKVTQVSALPRPPVIDPAQLFPPGEQPKDLSQVATLRLHGSPTGFAGATNEAAATAMVAEIRRANEGRAPEQQIKYVVLQSCSQGDRVSFGSTNAKAFEKAMNASLKGTGTHVQVLASREAGIITGHGADLLLPDGTTKPAEFVPPSRQRFQLTDTEKKALMLAGPTVAAATAAAAGTAVYVVVKIVKDDDDGTSKPRPAPPRRR